MAKSNPPAETLGSIKRNNGQQIAEMVRECDPNGRIVVHPIRKSVYAHERLHSAKKLADELYDAAEKFRLDFERAQLSGNYARMDLFKTRAGRQEISDNVAAAKVRISKALEELAQGRDGAPSFSQSCMWNVVGLGMTLDQFTDFIRANGGAMNSDKASGILHSSLERLALHYGLIDMGKMAMIQSDNTYRRALKDFFEFLTVFSATSAGPEKGATGRLMLAMQKRWPHIA